MPTTTPNPAELAASIKRLADNYADWAATHAADFGYDETQAYVGTPECKRDRDALHALIDQLRDLASGPSEAPAGECFNNGTVCARCGHTEMIASGPSAGAGDCPRCNGSGEFMVMDSAGPDAREVPANCDHCGGVGGIAEAYEGIVKLLAASESKRLQLAGVAYFSRPAAPAATPPAEKEVRASFCPDSANGCDPCCDHARNPFNRETREALWHGWERGFADARATLTQSRVAQLETDAEVTTALQRIQEMWDDLEKLNTYGAPTAYSMRCYSEALDVLERHVARLAHAEKSPEDKS